MKQFLPYLKNYQKESILSPLFKMLEACFELLVPLVMANIIDVAIKNRDTAEIFKMGGLLVALGVIGLACSITAQYFAAKAAVGFATALRKDLFQHIQSLSYAEIDTIGTATLITRMTNDINQLQNGVNMVLRLFLRSPFIVFGSMIMAFMINYRAAFIFVIVIIVLSVIVFGITALCMPYYQAVQAKLDKVLLRVRENLIGVRVIRAFNREEQEAAEFREENQGLKKLQLRVGKIAALLNPITYVCINVAILILIWIAGQEVDSSVITQGEVVALVNYMSQILVELIKLAGLIVLIMKIPASANRIQAVFKQESSLSEGIITAGSGQNAKGDMIVSFREISFLYPNTKETVLEGITVAVKRGQKIGIIGGTGSGKSTLVQLIPRFYDAASGDILIDGIPVKEYTYEALRQRIGFVPQKSVLMKGSILDNMRFRKEDATEEEVKEALIIAQAWEFVEPLGLHAPVSQGGANFSGGQKQRLTIARALVGKPDILILDDSSSALDFATDYKLRKAIDRHCGQMTVFIVSQRASTIRNADLILVLEDGQTAGIGTHEELLQTCSVYQEICYSQHSF